MSNKRVLNWMKNHANEYLDCGEVQLTALAEAACQHFDAYGPAPRYDCPDEYFDLAVDAAEWYEKGR